MPDDLVRSELHHSVTEVNEARNGKAVDRTFTNIKTAAVENMSLFLNDKISDQMLSNVSHKVPYLISNLCNIHAFAATHIDNEIFSSFGLLLGARRIMRVSVFPPISCSSSTDPS